MVRALVSAFAVMQFRECEEFRCGFEGAREECAGSFTGAGERSIPILVRGG